MKEVKETGDLIEDNAIFVYKTVGDRDMAARSLHSPPHAHAAEPLILSFPVQGASLVDNYYALLSMTATWWDATLARRFALLCIATMMVSTIECAAAT